MFLLGKAIQLTEDRSRKQLISDGIDLQTARDEAYKVNNTSTDQAFNQVQAWNQKQRRLTESRTRQTHLIKLFKLMSQLQCARTQVGCLSECMA